MQTEVGDVLKVTVEWEGQRVRGLAALYFDSLYPARALCVLRNGFLLAAGSQPRLYQFVSPHSPLLLFYILNHDSRVLLSFSTL